MVSSVVNGTGRRASSRLCERLWLFSSQTRRGFVFLPVPYERRNFKRRIDLYYTVLLCVKAAGWDPRLWICKQSWSDEEEEEEEAGPRSGRSPSCFLLRAAAFQPCLPAFLRFCCSAACLPACLLAPTPFVLISLPFSTACGPACLLLCSRHKDQQYPPIADGCLAARQQTHGRGQLVGFVEKDDIITVVFPLTGSLFNAHRKQTWEMCSSSGWIVSDQPLKTWMHDLKKEECESQIWVWVHLILARLLKYSWRLFLSVMRSSWRTGTHLDEANQVCANRVGRASGRGEEMRERWRACSSW